MRNRAVHFLILSALILLMSAAWSEAQADANPFQDCDSGAYAARDDQNNTHYLQQHMDAMNKVNSQFPAFNTAQYCMDNLIKKFASIGLASDPFKMIGQAIINQLLNQVCQQVTADVSQITNSISQLGKICMPKINPSSNSLFGTFNLGIKPPTCSGGTSVNLLSTSTSSQGGNRYGTQQFFGQ
jgi:hypothetical protein